MLYQNMSELIGNTPLIRLQEIEKSYNLDCQIYGKLEKQNPGGSIKDRAVYQMLINATKQGLKLEGANIVEATSGNTGIAMAMLSHFFKYKAYIVMPSSMSQQRKDLIKNFGATLVLVDGPLKNSIAKAEELLKELPNSLTLNQFANPGNLESHFLTTGREIVADLPDVDCVVAGFGTGGTISGIGKYFKENNIKAKAIGVEPEESAFITKGVAGKHGIPGIGAGFKPDNLKLEYVDEILAVNSDQTNVMAKEILCKEGLFVGVSSGASLLGAINYIKSNDLHNKKIVVIFPDTGERYSWN